MAECSVTTGSIHPESVSVLLREKKRGPKPDPPGFTEPMRAAGFGRYRKPRGDLFTQSILRVPTTWPSDMPSEVPYMMPGDYVEGVFVPFRYWPGLRREFYRYPIQTTKRLKPQELGANLLRWRWFNPDVVLTPGVWWRLKEKGHSNASILNLRWKLIYEIVADYQAARGPRSRWRKRRKNGTWTRWRKRRDPDKERTDRIKEHEWSYPKPILKPDGKRPPVGRTLKQPHAAKQAREWHARWLVWWAQEGYRILPRNAADGVISLATAGIKRAHTSQISYRRGLNSLSIMERADGSEVYALPERVKVDASWGTTPRAITRERQRMAGERAGRETVPDFSDPYFKSHARRVFSLVGADSRTAKLAADVYTYMLKNSNSGVWEGFPKDFYEQLDSDYKPARPEDLSKSLRGICRNSPVLDFELLQRVSEGRPFRLTLRIADIADIADTGDTDAA